MKKIGLSLHYITLVVICQVLAMFTGAAEASAGVNDFDFESFSADYYLTRDAEGVSHLKVDETVVALFPEYRQNKGICRQIPFTNQDGANVTLPSLTRSDIVVTRNGVSEPIYSIKKDGDYYNVCTGTDEYVLGRQEYRFQYEYQRVVTEFPEYQELYWDTNGNGASQKFGLVTARVHFGDVDWWTGRSWCYVGQYGVNGQDRCVIKRTSDGVEFTARNLKAHENLTYDVELVSGSFVVPEPEKNWTLVIILALLAAGLMVPILFQVWRWRKLKEKREYYKGYFVKPEYQPSREYDVAEMAEIYIGDKKDAKTAVMLDMIVKKRIRLVQREEKKWAVEVLDTAGLNGSERVLLEILNGGEAVADGDTIELKSRSATSELVKLASEYWKDLKSRLEHHGLVEKKFTVGSVRGAGFDWGSIVVNVVIYTVMSVVVGLVIYSALTDEEDGVGLIGYVVGESWFVPAFVGICVVGITVITQISSSVKMYGALTKLGLTQSRYMDGLKLYIKMAEADRMKLLQSVEGADVSADGVVKIYEKLLPYVAVFGLEKSWMNELQEYCKVQELEEPEWAREYSVVDVLVASNLATRYVRNSSTMSSSGGGSSSGSSGGGGGGFSGGGGGGGGFSGR